MPHRPIPTPHRPIPIPHRPIPIPRATAPQARERRPIPIPRLPTLTRATAPQVRERSHSATDLDRKRTDGLLSACRAALVPAAFAFAISPPYKRL
eukprot:6173091-Prymnesium_polylepis.1